eukprot:scaffold140711_cov18-Tisochrysis_lutea.AAC.2
MTTRLLGGGRAFFPEKLKQLGIWDHCQGVLVLFECLDKVVVNFMYNYPNKDTSTQGVTWRNRGIGCGACKLTEGFRMAKAHNQVPKFLATCTACSVSVSVNVAILEMESELMDLKYQLEQERALRVKAEQVRMR